MKTDNGLAIAFFGVVIGSAVALAIANDITAPICKAAAEATPKDKFDFGCLEFWLNRYQGLAGNLITAGVAAITLVWINRTLSATNRQTSAIAADGLRRRAEEVEAEIATYLEITSTLLRFRVDLLVTRNDMTISGIFVMSRWCDRAVEQFCDLTISFQKLRIAHLDVERARLDHRIRKTLSELDAAVNVFQLGDAFIGGGQSIENGEDPANLEEVGAKTELAEASWKHLDQLLKDFVELRLYAIADLNRTWARIRAFERAAVDVP